MDAKRAIRKTVWAALLVTLLTPPGLIAGHRVKFGHFTMADGVPEMVGSEGEVFGYKHVGSILQEAGALPPQGVIDHFSNATDGWADGKPQDDDVTLVVMRMKAA